MPAKLPDKLLTVTGKLRSENYSAKGVGVFLVVKNSDGSITKWYVGVERDNWRSGIADDGSRAIYPREVTRGGR